MADRQLSGILATLRERAMRFVATVFAPFRRRRRRLNASPTMIAVTLHQIIEKDSPQLAPQAFRLPEAVLARFREKLFLYREANILLAIMDRVDPSRESKDSLFEPVFWAYERIIFEEWPRIFGELTKTQGNVARRQSVTVALRDLNARIHPPTGNRYELARNWARDWFADIGHNEINPASLTQFSLFWPSEYTAVQNALDAMIVE
jgi:hypothetical protein